MTCREFADFMLEYSSGELPPDARAIFERHLERCTNCRTYLELYLRTVEACRRAADADLDVVTTCGVPEDLITAILAARQR